MEGELSGDAQRGVAYFVFALLLYSTCYPSQCSTGNALECLSSRAGKGSAAGRVGAYRRSASCGIAKACSEL